MSERDKYLEGLADRTVQVLHLMGMKAFTAETEAEVGRGTIANLIRKQSIPNTETIYKIWKLAKSRGVNIEMNWYICGVGAGLKQEVVIAELKQKVSDLQEQLIACLMDKQASDKQRQEK